MSIKSSIYFWCAPHWLDCLQIQSDWPPPKLRCLFKGEFHRLITAPPPPRQDNKNILQSRSVHRRSWPGTAERGSPCCLSSRRLYRTKPGLWWMASAGTSCTYRQLTEDRTEDGALIKLITGRNRREFLSVWTRGGQTKAEAAELVLFIADILTHWCGSVIQLNGTKQSMLLIISILFLLWQFKRLQSERLLQK